MTTRWRGAAVMGAFLAMTSLAGGTGAMVSAATPAGTSACPYPPLTLPLFAGTPVTQIDTTVDPIGNVTDAELEETLRGFAACASSPSAADHWAMYSPGWFARTFADPTQHYLPALEQQIDRTPVPGSDPIEFVTVRRSSVAGNTVTVMATFRSGEVTWDDTLSLVRVHGRLMIDQVLTQPDVATPASQS